MKIELITTAVSFLIAITTTIISIIKAKKGKKSEELVDLAKIVQKIPQFITEAEELFGTGTGTAKLRFVLNQLNIECLKAGIEFKEDALKNEIEEILKTPQKKEE